MKIFQNKDKEVFIKKTGQNKYLINIPYDKITKTGQKRKVFWVNFPWWNLKILKKTDLNNGSREIIVQAETIQTLPEFLSKKKYNISYQFALQLFTDIGNQIKTLEQFSLYISPFDLNNIVVIGEHFFFMEDTSNINFLNSNTIKINPTQLTLIHSWQKNKFSSLEIRKIKSLPQIIPIKSSYFNLGALVVFCLFKKYINVESKKMEDEVETIIENIKETKLYWALKRCLEVKAENRFILLI
jgi:hypothetical protein